MGMLIVIILLTFINLELSNLYSQKDETNAILKDISKNVRYLNDKVKQKD
jgi:hypothetical protein